MPASSTDALHAWGAEHSQQVNGYAPDVRKKVYEAFTARLTELEELEAVADQVVHEEDGERPARPEDFAEDTAEQIAGSISERAIDARNGPPPRLQELNGPDDSPDMPPKPNPRRFVIPEELLEKWSLK